MLKNIASYLTLTISILLYASFSSNETIDLSEYSTKGLVLNYNVGLDANINNNIEASNEGITTFSPYLGKSFVGFKEALAFKESRGNYSCVNTYGYLGKYQFGKSTLKMIGIHNPNKFLKDPELQEKAFMKNKISNYFTPYIGFSDDDLRNVQTMRKHFPDKDDLKIYATSKQGKEEY